MSKLKPSFQEAFCREDDKPACHPLVNSIQTAKHLNGGRITLDQLAACIAQDSRRKKSAIIQVYNDEIGES